MHKNLSQLEHTVQDKVCRFICDHDTSIEIVKECLFQFQKYIGQIEDIAKAQNTQCSEEVKQEPNEEQKEENKQSSC